ncbi:MAG: phytanoyl-CoA dioxygenase family protein [Bacteroidota bacterium]
MSTTSTLTATQVEFYHTQGYLLLPSLYSEAEVDQMRALIANDIASGGWTQAPYHGEDVTTDIYERIPALARLVLSQSYLYAMRDLFGPDTVVLAEPAVHRGRYYYWHKDSTFLDEQGEDFHWQDDFAAAMTVLYLQGNDPTHGGGLTVVPRTQRDPDFYHRIPTMSTMERLFLKAQKLFQSSHFDRLERHPDLLPIPSKKGDLLVIDMRLDHRGTPALRPPPAEKYGIMNIACTGQETADRLSQALRRRPSGYYQDYLAKEPETTPILQALETKYGVPLQL